MFVSHLQAMYEEFTVQNSSISKHVNIFHKGSKLNHFAANVRIIV